MPENMVGDPENRLLGLEKLPGEAGCLPFKMRGVAPVPALDKFLSVFVSGPDLVSRGSGFNESCSTVGFCFMSLSLAFSAAIRAFSLLNFTSFHGSMLTRKPCFLEDVDGSGSLSILMDNLGGFWKSTGRSIHDGLMASEDAK